MPSAPFEGRRKACQERFNLCRPATKNCTRKWSSATFRRIYSCMSGVEKIGTLSAPETSPRVRDAQGHRARRAAAKRSPEQPGGQPAFGAGWPQRPNPFRIQSRTNLTEPDINNRERTPRESHGIFAIIAGYLRKVTQFPQIPSPRVEFHIQPGEGHPQDLLSNRRRNPEKKMTEREF